MNCSALTMIRLPYELTTIEANTFSGCTAMGGALYLPLDLETIGDSAFENCRAIGKVHVFGYVTRIGKMLSRAAKALQKQLMPESKEDGPSLFPGAQAMKNLKTQALPPMFTEKTFFQVS